MADHIARHRILAARSGNTRLTGRALHLTQRQQRGVGQIRADDTIVDVEFETVDSTSAPKAERSPTVLPGDKAPATGLGVFGSARTRREARREPMPLPLFALIAALCAFGAFYLAGGHALFVRAVSTDAPASTATAPSPTADTLRLDDVTTRIDTSAGRPVFVIRATIANDATEARFVPPVQIVFDLPDGTGSMVHTIARGETLAAGERMAFTTRIPAGEYAGVEPRLSFAR